MRRANKEIKEMSMKELIFKDEHNQDIIVKFKDNLLWIDTWEFDRSEAHLLMLYLQEHLKAPSAIGKGLDDAITGELNNPPKDITK